MASDIRAKSSFCGFTDIVGSGVVSFDRVTAESNVDGASIDGGTGLVTVGAESSYQVDRILCTGLEDACTSWLEYILEYIYGGGNFDTWTSFLLQVSLSLQMKTDPGSTHKFWVSKNGENMVTEIFYTKS